jgi:dephospho-CoA kinase
MKCSKLVVGITGGIGSGKTAVSNHLASLGVTVIDTDEISRQLTQAGGMAIQAISDEFGSKFIHEDGAMDRRAMRQLVFSDSVALERLEQIVHPLIKQVAEQAISSAPSAYVVAVVPLLIERGSWKSLVHRILVVDCELETQIQRVIQRSKMTREEVKSIISTQADRQTRLSAAGDVILNEHLSLQALYGQVESLHKKYLNAAINFYLHESAE